MVPLGAWSAVSLVVKDPVILIIKEVWNLFSCFFFAKTTFTTVAADKLASALKAVDGQNTAVGTALAAGHGGLIL